MEWYFIVLFIALGIGIGLFAALLYFVITFHDVWR